MKQSRKKRRPSGLPAATGLYDPANEHDSCGVGFLANITGEKTHALVRRGCEVLQNLLHRGAIGGDKSTSDGAGILFQVPDAFFRRQRLGFDLPAPDTYGVGFFFLPRAKAARSACVDIIEQTAAAEGFAVLGWRDVPVNAAIIQGQALAEMPVMRQLFVASAARDEDLERRLYIARRLMEKKCWDVIAPEDMFYVCSLSARTIIYKGLLMGAQVPEFYLDLNDEAVTSSLAIIHQRYSTNTFPSWELAQPFRHLAHNGEINTLRGNINHMAGREKHLAHPLFGDDIKKILPVIMEGGSDSAALDNALELLLNGGREPAHAMMMLISEAWGPKYLMGPDLRGFFEYHAGLMEPWDGPAAVAFTNGRQIGALLDRNGLRPVRYTITKDDFIVLASETGVLDIEPANISERGALRPGEMILVDTLQKRVMRDTEIKSYCARQQPYRRWVEENRIDLHGFYGAIQSVDPDYDTLFHRQKVFGYSREDIDIILSFMAVQGKEPIGSMGNDSPLAVFSEEPKLLFAYFKQLFAQITNPAIDPIREELVMSLMTFMGNEANILSEVPANARLIKLRHPFLSNEDIRCLRHQDCRGFESRDIHIGFPIGGDGNALDVALRRMRRDVERAIDEGCRLIMLTDRDLPEGQMPIPSLLATATVNAHLKQRGVRTSCGVIVETGEAREVMHMALLLGYGATAVNPYLAFETIADLALKQRLGKKMDVAKAIESYIKGLCGGLRKIMSKMGISTLRSYRGAQIFEAIGISKQVIDAYFPGTVSRIGGICLDDIAREVNGRYDQAVISSGNPSRDTLLPSGGVYRWRNDGERHLWTPDSVAKLQDATRRNCLATYREYAALINEQTRKTSTLRGLMRFKPATAIPIEEVEPVEAIMKRFVTGAMSFGSISREAHEALAIAMNRIGGMSNSGEGGEDPARFAPLPNGDSRCSAIKQVASGRFGVTIEYMVNCKELQIKISQGAKPGEGGQLPGHKVNAEIARVRHSTPGVSLISPPPHHDIYSIEDIAQLIFDLKNANPEARVTVKLVSESGVGTIAAGVSKAKADMVLISGHDGGTGASPLSSIQHAGLPWELGLAETQQTLVLNKLRSRIRVQTDGQLKTGRDVVIAALLGAEEYGFATTGLVVLGCVMMRCCHQNTCPVGVATQDPELRKRFKGCPDFVVNFMRFVAGEAREYMAELGFRTIDDMVGRTDRLEMTDAVSFWKARGLDYSAILGADLPADAPRRCTESQHHDIDDILDRDLIQAAKPALEKGQPVVIDRAIRNVNRTVGAMLAGEVAKRYGLKGLPDDTIAINLTGAAGQSFGAFAARGMTIRLSGEANDYCGKGLSGGRLIITPEPETDYDPSENMIAGNVLLYGATSGEVYLHGRAGERFAIRNSGVKAVVEGVGDHACEYMTGGRVVILGGTGVNFGAGMSGGIAYVYNEDGAFDNRCNLEMVDLELVKLPEDVAELRGMIQNHFNYTGSPKAKKILDNWDDELGAFIKVFPMEYRRVLGQMSREDEATEREEVING
ncbi:MAG: glutamate synthase large subunit [Lentisphaeria bacterium]|nr:glutamate synthase large subunit [Lentisphaeria bacterium]